MLMDKVSYSEKYISENNNGYILKLLDEYKKATGTREKSDIQIKKGFLEWYRDNLTSLIVYSKFIEFFIGDGNAIEVGHGYLDTTTDYMKKKDLATLTLYKDSYPFKFNKWVIEGYLLNYNNSSRMMINNREISLKNIKTLYSQISEVSNIEIPTLVSSISDDTNIIIGTYGKTYDKDKKQNLNKIVSLYTEFDDLRKFEVEKYSTEMNDNYLGFVKAYKKDNK